MGSEAALVRDFLLARFSGKRLGSAVGLLPSVSSFSTSAVKRKGEMQTQSNGQRCISKR